MRKSFSLAMIMGASLLSGCANMPPLLQDHNGQIGLYMPTANDLMNAALYQSTAQIHTAFGLIDVEHNTLTQHIRFYIPYSGQFFRAPGYTNGRLIEKPIHLQNGDTICIFEADYQGVPNIEKMVLFQPNKTMGALTLASSNETPFVVKNVSGNEILFSQKGVADPLLRSYNGNTGTLTGAVSQSFLNQYIAEQREKKLKAEQQRQEQIERQEEAARQARDQAKEERLQVEQQQQEEQNRIRQEQTQEELAARKEQEESQAIAINTTSMTVSAQVPDGHQKTAPQEVNLQ